jgi:acetylornithine deacetylase/succinyl-diaminopimelate desuccinylase-like protein
MATRPTAPGGTDALTDYIDQVWRDDIEPALHDYIRIPNVSVAFDADWKANGHMDRAVDLVATWCRSRHIAGLRVDVHELAGRTPMIVAEIPAFNGGPSDDTVILYGHLDKQPEMTGWRDGLGPWTPVVEGDRLYGRGGADDGYAAFASMLAIEATQRDGRAHARLVVLIEASEESGSPDLPAHLDALADRIGTPSLVLCLDSGCLDDQRMWVTTSLRGLCDGVLTVRVLEHGQHSGVASGLVPSSMRIARILLDRVERAETGEILLPDLHVAIPDDRRRQAAATAQDFAIADDMPFAHGTRPTCDEPTEQLLATTWRPTLSITGADGLPPTDRAGNVLRPFTSLRLSFRLPPTCDPDAALAAVQRALTDDPPYGARVSFTDCSAAPGWNAPSFAPWLTAALDDASDRHFGAPARAFGEGGTIPFMGMLGEMFPEAQFVITGVLLPDTNAHGPNEYLPLAAARRVTGCLTDLLHAHATR